jgi:hypothetical protein
MTPDGQGRDCAAAEANCRVYAFYVSQSPDKMRSADRLICSEFPRHSEACTQPPYKKPVSIPCAGKDGSCSMAEFIKLTTEPLT